MIITKYISSSFQDGLKKLKMLVVGKKGVETAYESTPFGIDGQSPKGWRAIYSPTQRRGKKIILGWINLNRLEDLTPGSNRIFSTNEAGDSLSIDIILRNDGTMEIAGNTDFAVRYNELETAFNQLQADHDALAQEWDTFAAAYVPGSPTVTGLPPTVSTVGSSSADITPAKIHEIKVKGV